MLFTVTIYSHESQLMDMVQDLAVVVTVLLAIALLPALLLWAFLRLIGADGTRITEFGDGSTTEFESIGLQSDSERTGASVASPDRSAAGDDAVSCDGCGAENDARFDRCWNCFDPL